MKQQNPSVEIPVVEKKPKSRLLWLTRFLSHTPVIAACGIAAAAGLWLLENCLCNLILQILENLSHLLTPDYNIGIHLFFAVGGAPWYIYVIMAAVAVGAGIRTAYLLFRNYGTVNFGQRGVQRWATMEEIKAQYPEIEEKDTPFPGRGGLPISRMGDKLYIDNTLTNNLIIGITRSGKGEMYVFPLIDICSRAEKKQSLIVSDPKKELYKASAETLRARGYEVHILNLENPDDSMGYNPLQIIIDAYKREDYSEAELLCSTFAYSIYNPSASGSDSKLWDSASVAMLCALIMAHIEDCLEADKKANTLGQLEWTKKRAAYTALKASEKKHAQRCREIYECRAKGLDIKQTAQALSSTPATVKKYWDECESIRKNYVFPDEAFVPTRENEKKINMYSILNTFTTLARKKFSEFEGAIDLYFSRRPACDPAKLKYGTVELAGQKTKGSVFINTQTALTAFLSEKNARLTAESSINLLDVGFGEKPIAVFISMPDYDKSNHFFASVFIRQLYFVLAKAATNSQSGKCAREVRFILDEFGNIPPIESMDQLITVCLGRGICFVLVIQSYAQVETLYGKAADTIIGNCANQVYIMTNDEKTASKFSVLLGKETIEDISRTGAAGGKKSYTESTSERPLLDENRLMNLTEGESVVKRVAKRTDLQGNKIRPYPILNTGKSRMKYRYEYLTDTFKDPDKVDFNSILDESTRQIDLRSRVWDADAYLDRLTEEIENGEDGASRHPQSELQLKAMIKDLKKGPEIIEILLGTGCFGENCGTMTVESVTGLLEQSIENDCPIMPEEQRLEILRMMIEER